MDSSMSRTLRCASTFSLDQALRFLNGFAPAGAPRQEQGYRRAHVINGMPRLLELRSMGGEGLRLSVHGQGLMPEDVDAAERLVRRMFSLDWDGHRFYEEVGAADPVMRELQARYPGLRPVLFGAPFEALCWAVIGQRISIAQASRLKMRLVEAFGPKVEALGATWQAFPGPEHLLSVDSGRYDTALGLPPIKLARLAGLARRGVAGELEAERLLSQPADEAREWLERSPGIGPWGSEFALIRGAGHPDMFPAEERRLVMAIQRYYRLTHEPTTAEVEQLGRKWAGVRTWAVFLLRVALQEDTGEIKAPSCGAMESKPRQHKKKLSSSQNIQTRLL